MLVPQEYYYRFEIGFRILHYLFFVGFIKLHFIQNVSDEQFLKHKGTHLRIHRSQREVVNFVTIFFVRERYMILIIYYP